MLVLLGNYSHTRYTGTLYKTQSMSFKDLLSTLNLLQSRIVGDLENVEQTLILLNISLIFVGFYLIYLIVYS